MFYWRDSQWWLAVADSPGHQAGLGVIVLLKWILTERGNYRGGKCATVFYFHESPTLAKTDPVCRAVFWKSLGSQTLKPLLHPLLRNLVTVDSVICS